MVQSLKRFLLVGAVAVAFASSARADLILRIEATGFGPFLIVDNDGNDLDPTVGVISVDTDPATGGSLNEALAAGNTGLIFDALGTDITSVTGDATLNTSGTVRQDSALGDGLVTISATNDFYAAVVGGLGIMSSSASDTFGSPGAVRSFQSFVDPANVHFGLTVPSGILLFAGTNTSDSGAAPDTGPIALPGVFSLTNITNIALGGEGSQDLFTGRTTIRAVPEPGSLALMVLGSSALAFGIRRRRAVTA